jgi:hypothetical protein
MSERIVSPGVFTRENDLSFLIQGISEIGGAFIGPTPKGPAFIPTIVRSQQDYVTQFGDADANHYTGLTVKNYLRESGVATIVRVLGLEGYDNSDHAVAGLYVTGDEGTYLYALLHPSDAGVTITAAAGSGSVTDFNLDIDVPGTAADIDVVGLSTDPNSDKYIVDFLGTSPQTSRGVYIYSLFPEAVSLAGDNASISVVRDISLVNFKDRSYENAVTPWIRSQTLGGERYDLFRVHTISDGNNSNKEIKVSFTNMKLSTNPEDPYGTFSMFIRRFDDTDARPVVLEQYDNVTMDPNSANYIARVIGNSLPVEDLVTGEMYYQGDFPNRSSYVIIELNEDGGIPEDALPYGFGPYQSPVVDDVSNLVAPNYLTTRWVDGGVPGYTTTAVDRRHFYGWDFRVADGTNNSYLNSIPTNAPNVGLEFRLEDISDVPDGETTKLIDLEDDSTLRFRRFSVAFQGGFDGQNPARKIALGEDIVPTNSQGFNLQTTQTAGSKAYFKAIQAISNPDQFDFNLLVLPGVIYEFHSSVTDRALNLCEERGDAFYIMDTVGLNATLTAAVGKAGEIDSNYAATYYPWLRVIDTNTNRLIWVPPSVILPEIYAYNDNIAAEWFAPAGLNRGGISAAVGVRVRLPQPSRDTLYEGKVNPIAQFPGQGIVVWGQKTLQRRASALDRVNVRRLLIAVKKYIASVSRYLVFEQNVEATRNRFLNIVNPYLASVQERSGLFAFRVIMDETNNTPDLIDRNILFGQIYLQPTRTAEFIILDFNVLPTGAVFPTA